MSIVQLNIYHFNRHNYQSFITLMTHNFMIRTIANSTACLLMITDRSSLGLNYIYIYDDDDDDDDDHDIMLSNIGAAWRITEIDYDDNDCMMRYYVSTFLMMITMMIVVMMLLLMSMMVVMMIMVILSMISP